MLLAGVVGLVAAASSTRADAERTASSLTGVDGASAQHRATASLVQADDDRSVAVDLPATILGPGLNLLAASLTAVAAAMIATRRSTLPAVANGRAPPRR